VAEDEDDQEQTGRTHRISVAGCNQVTAVCQEEPFLFLGFDSGTIQCRSLNAKKEDNSQEYPCMSFNSNTHSNEVACLAKAGNTHLASGGSKEDKSAVYIHWNALRDGKLDRVSRIPISPSSSAGPALSVASTMSCDDAGHSMYVTHGTANGTLHISVWNEVAPPLENYTFHQPFRTIDGALRSIVSNPSSNPFLGGHVIYLAYMGYPQQPQETKRLVVGTSTGYLVVAKHDVVHPGLKNAYTWEYDCAVEAVELVGSVLIVAGGAFGKIAFLDWETGDHLYDLQIHPGRFLHHGRTKLRSTVIDMTFCHERSSLICLCRDGYVEEWSIQDELERIQKKKRQRKIQQVAQIMSFWM
jgi:hypothetical protein